VKTPTRFRIVPSRPYSLALTAARFARFPEIVDRFDGRTYRRLVLAGREAALVEVFQRGRPDRAVLEVSLEGPGAGSPAAAAAARRLVERSLGAASGADVGLTEFYRACAADPLLAASIRDFRGLRIAGYPSLWEALVTAILCQQVNLRFAYDIRRELALALGRRARIGGAVHVDFPSPAALARLAPRALRRFRLSRTKAAAIRGLALAFAEGRLVEGALAPLSDEAAIETLCREGMPPNHLEDVAELSSRVAVQLRLSSIDAVRCRLAGWLHDVGKVAVPDHILNKPGPLTDDEWEIMREHVVIGEHLVRQVPELADAASGVRHHHERWDGTGYPDRLRGEEIPLAARIIAVVDAYSAMTSPRVYSKARSTFAAVAELERCAGSHFDPAVVAAFVRVLEVAGIAASSA